MKKLSDNQYNWIQDAIEDALTESENENTAYAFKSGYLKGALIFIQKVLQELDEE